MAFQFGLRAAVVLAAIGFERFHVGVNVEQVAITARPFAFFPSKPGFCHPLQCIGSARGDRMRDWKATVHTGRHFRGNVSGLIFGFKKHLVHRRFKRTADQRPLLGCELTPE